VVATAAVASSLQRASRRHRAGGSGSAARCDADGSGAFRRGTDGGRGALLRNAINHSISTSTDHGIRTGAAVAARSDGRVGGGGGDVELAAFRFHALGAVGLEPRAGLPDRVGDYGEIALGAFPFHASSAEVANTTDSGAPPAPITLTRPSANHSNDLLIEAFLFDIVAAGNTDLGVPTRCARVVCCAAH